MDFSKIPLWKIQNTPIKIPKTQNKFQKNKINSKNTK